MLATADSERVQAFKTRPDEFFVSVDECDGRWSVAHVRRTRCFRFEVTGDPNEGNEIRGAHEPKIAPLFDGGSLLTRRPRRRARQTWRISRRGSSPSRPAVPSGGSPSPAARARQPEAPREVRLVSGLPGVQEPPELLGHREVGHDLRHPQLPALAPPQRQRRVQPRSAAGRSRSAIQRGFPGDVAEEVGGAPQPAPA